MSRYMSNYLYISRISKASYHFDLKGTSVGTLYSFVVLPQEALLGDNGDLHVLDGAAEGVCGSIPKQRLLA